MTDQYSYQEVQNQLPNNQFKNQNQNKMQIQTSNYINHKQQHNTQFENFTNNNNINIHNNSNTNIIINHNQQQHQPQEEILQNKKSVFDTQNLWNRAHFIQNYVCDKDHGQYELFLIIEYIVRLCRVTTTITTANNNLYSPFSGLGLQYDDNNQKDSFIKDKDKNKNKNKKKEYWSVPFVVAKLISDCVAFDYGLMNNSSMSSSVSWKIVAQNSLKTFLGFNKINIDKKENTSISWKSERFQNAKLTWRLNLSIPDGSEFIDFRLELLTLPLTISMLTIWIEMECLNTNSKYRSIRNITANSLTVGWPKESQSLLELQSRSLTSFSTEHKQHQHLHQNNFNSNNNLYNYNPKGPPKVQFMNLSKYFSNLSKMSEIVFVCRLKILQITDRDNFFCFDIHFKQIIQLGLLIQN
jgi:hypothetical protein